MKLLLTKTVSQLGIVGDVVNVSAGYARNYLIPRRLATEPTDANMRRLAEARKQAELEMARERARLEEIIQRLEGVEVTVAARANEEGVLYGSVGRKEIAAALAEEGHGIPPENIALTSPIRRLDTVSVEVRFTGDMRANIKVWVVREKTGEDEEAAELGQPTPAGMEAGEHDNHRDE